MSQDLRTLRERIDDIDRRIVDLLNARAAVARQIGALKGRESEEIFSPARERRVLNNVATWSEGPFSDEAVQEIYRAILAASRALEKQLRIAYLGPEATFTHEASKRKFGTPVDYLPAPSIADVFLMTEKGEADYGVVPVENSTEGVVNHTLDMFMESELKICAEVSLPIAHFLLSRSPVAQVKRVYSHPQALAQSRRWLAENLKGVDIVEVPSTARAAQMASQEAGAAAIAPQLAAEVYGLQVLAGHIEDRATNITRFLIIGSRMSEHSGHDKTALMFCLQDRVGALHDALAVFKRHDINLTMIESRPTRTQLWDWVFFVDCAGHPQDQPVESALRELRHHCTLVKVLGAWPVD